MLVGAPRATSIFLFSSFAFLGDRRGIRRTVSIGMGFLLLLHLELGLWECVGIRIKRCYAPQGFTLVSRCSLLPSLVYICIHLILLVASIPSYY